MTLSTEELLAILDRSLPSTHPLVASARDKLIQGARSDSVALGILSAMETHRSYTKGRDLMVEAFQSSCDMVEAFQSSRDPAGLENGYTIEVHVVRR